MCFMQRYVNQSYQPSRMWSPIFDECPDARSVVPHLETSGCCLQNAKPCCCCFFRKKCFVFCPALKLKNVGNYGQGYWDLTRFLRQSDLISQTNTHTHTQRYKTHSGASKLTHPKIYTYATFYELTAAIFITMNE